MMSTLSTRAQWLKITKINSIFFQVLVNTEGCVNTLQGECTEFYLDRRRDGRNYSSNDRFPCYYTPHHDKFVTAR